MQRANHRGSFFHRVASGLFILLGLTAAAPVLAIVPQVQDGGKFFSASAIQQANDQIRQIKDQSGKDLVIETYDAPPTGRTAPSDEAGRSQFFKNWVVERGTQLDIDGVVVLICRHPAWVETASGKSTRVRIFPTDKSVQLSKMMIGQFKNKQFDAGLLEATSFVQRTMQANGAGQAPPVVHTTPYSAPPPTYTNPSYPPRVSTGTSHICLWTFVGLIVLVIIVRVIGSMSGGGSGGNTYMGGGGSGYAGPQNFGGGYGGGGYGPGYGGGGGGGFMRSMLGGVLGGAAGSWLYDRFSRNDSNYGGSNFGGGTNYTGNPGGSEQPAGPTDQSQSSDQGQGFDQASGGSFDSGSSSSDSGSSSNYDSGSSSYDSGGDSGGGGGDSGGGGGDF